MNLLTSALFVAALGWLVVWGRRREPGWISGDGRRFIARARVIDERGGRPGRWMHVRGGLGESAVVIQPGFTGSRSVAGRYTQVTRISDDHHGAVIYALRGEKTLALRVYGTDRLIAALDGLANRSN